MKAAVYHGNHTVSLDEVPDPVIRTPTDAIVDIEYAGVCGSDLWTYRDMGAAAPNRIGHEFVGTVREIGDGVRDIRPGDWVIVPFRYSDGTCRYCRRGLETACVNGGFWGRETEDAGQGQAARVPYADATLVRALPDGGRPDSRFIPSLLTLADVFTTGYHAAVQAGVSSGDVVAVVGDGAVGLCAIMAAKLLGASQVIGAGSSHTNRNELARRFGADAVVTSRGDQAVHDVIEEADGNRPDKVLECVGSAQSFSSALDMCDKGGTVGFVGLPHGVSVDAGQLFFGNIAIAGGMSPARHYIAGLIPRVLDGSIDPGAVYTDSYSLSDIARAYDDMDNRRTIKPLIVVR